MKKFFTLVAVAMFAIAASADVIWNESLDKNGSYINKADFGNNWPYATQWYEAGNFIYEYDSIGSYGCSVRNKKLNSDTDNSIGFFFSKEKAAASNYLYIGGKDGAIVENAVNCKLMFDICSSEADGGDLSTMIVKVNGEAFAALDLALGNKLVTSPVEFTLPDGNIENIEIAFDNVPSQKFIAHLRIEGEGGTAHGEGGIIPPVVELDTITVAEAVEIGMALVDNGKTEKDYVVKGHVVQAYAPNEGYSDQTWFMADEAGAFGEFEAFRCTPDYLVETGDYVYVKGKIQKYVKDEKVQIEIGNGTATHGEAPEGIENIVLTEKAQKVVVDGVIYIVRDNKMFNLQGTQVR